MKSFFYYKQLIKHYGSATLIDVLHSPFVFALYNTCIKKNSKVQLTGFVPSSGGYLNRRAETVLAKLISDYPNHLVVYHPASIVSGFRYIFIPADDISLITLQQVIETLHNDSVVIVKDMYLTPQTKVKWQSIMQLNGVTASVDLFVMGLVFVRKEQRKQAFRLRLW